MAIAEGTYLTLASMDKTLPSGSGNTVSSLDDYQRQTRGHLIGLYNATHTAVVLSQTGAGTVDLQALSTATPYPGRISISGGGSITNFTNGIEGQMLYIIATGAVTFAAGTYLALSAGYTMGANDTLTLTLVGAVWHELSRSVNAVA